MAAFDRITREGKRFKYHYVIVDYVCRLKRGRLKPASDVVDARWVRREGIATVSPHRDGHQGYPASV